MEKLDDVTVHGSVLYLNCFSLSTEVDSMILCAYTGTLVGSDSSPRKPSIEYLLCRIEVEEWSFNYTHNLLCASPICRRKSREYEGQKLALFT